MYSRFQLAVRYLKYYNAAFNGRGHGVHSPFVFTFIKDVLNDRADYTAYNKMESLRRQLLKDDKLLTVDDFGAGSSGGTTKQRSVSRIARVSAKPKKYAQLIFRIAKYYQSHNLLELGTSLGLTTGYLALAAAPGKVFSLEGSTAIAGQALRNFNQLGLDNIIVQTGNFDDTLEQVLKSMKSVDLAFVDGNHRYQPTMAYFGQLLSFIHDNSIVIFDDIHWSREMEQAWSEIVSSEAVTLSIDLFFIGIVFFRRDFKVKQHFSIRF